MAQQDAPKPLFTVRTEDLEMRATKDPGIYAVTGYHLWARLTPGNGSWEENFQTEAERVAFMRGLKAGAMHFRGRIRVIGGDGYVDWVWGSAEEGDPEPRGDETPLERDSTAVTNPFKDEVKDLNQELGI